MALNHAAKGLVLLLVTASVLAIGQAKTIVVGGTEGWRYGFNYTDWAIQNTPFYIEDKLVFKYDPPSDTNSLAYGVYKLPNLDSYLSCNFSSAEVLANSTQGVGNGFEVSLNEWKPYYFASYGVDANHCNDGHMKFFAVPWPHNN
ncbi:blue copper protein 1a-like [Humulus lupulus]|uniref:blue copper protein 1a-like n=1 Tax=Humulus lupulus TaxID=3486 RepID=UPI002B4175A3|nr:blue copper protein 1a-like [Humulus lupulus]